MARYLVFNTEDEARACISKIDARASELLTALGRVRDGAGVGVNLATGCPDQFAQKTLTWTTPKQTASGKWVVLHPDNSSAGNSPIRGSKIKTKDHLVQDLTLETVAEESADWWPPNINPWDETR